MARTLHTRGTRNEENSMLRSRSLLGLGVVGAFTVVASAQPQTPAETPAESQPPAETPPAADAPPPAAPTESTSVTAKAAAPATATIRGKVLAKDGAPIAGAVITLGTSSAITDGEGNYELAQVPAGAQTMTIEATGYATRETAIEVVAGRVLGVTARMDTTELPGEEIIVTGTRLPEKRLDAPVTIEIVTEKDLRTTAGASYLSALSRVKGIDYSDAGIGDQRISARGFATQFNSRMLTMVDGRLATLPGNGLPQGNLLPTSGLDMKAVEVVIGPASALYGPNAHTGVVNIVTKTPWDDSGAAIMLRGGSQSMFAGAARVAGTVKDDFGYKLNGEFLRAEDFTPDRKTHTFAPNVFEGDIVDGYDLEQAKTDGTLYYKRGGWLTTAGAGFSNSTGFSLTNAGRNHLRDWQVQYQNVTVSSPHVYGQVTRTKSNAGKTYQLDRLARTVAMMGGVPANPADLNPLRDMISLTDNSSMIDSELQYRHVIAGVKTTLGAQYRAYAPSSAGTYLDDKTQDISMNEAGTYLQLDTLLFGRLRLAGAVRVDHHSLYSNQISPKAAVQYEIAENQNIRVGYNRAFKSPTILENYLRINDILLGNRTGFVIKDGAGNVISEIPALSPEKVDAFEVGYKAAIGSKLYVDAVAYQSYYRNFISALTSVANPMAAMPTFASYADGTPTAQGTALEGTLQTYMNFGKAKVRGVDVGFDFKPIEELTLSTSASAMQLASFENTNALQKDLVLNAPAIKFRGSVSAEDLGIKNSFWRIDGRYHAAYEFASGYWNSMTLLGGKVPARAVFDLSLGYKVPKTALTVSGTVANLLDDHKVDVLGAPTPGRLMWLQIAYDYEGLRY
jgi:outer membrane receptor for ferrienterochelin and colicins